MGPRAALFAMTNPAKAAKAVFAPCAAAAAFSAAAFANNVSAVVRWWAAFRRAGGVSELMPERVSGFFPWLDWAAVDHSCASTLIPALGFFLAARGAWRIMRRRPADPGDFPFFRSFDQVVVALGLAGTLWGIIVIGWHDLESVSMRDLMSCLHTALFSTLVAVVWVYFVDHPLLRPLLRRLLRDAGLDGSARRRESLDELLASLREGAHGLSEAWEGQGGALERLALAVDAVRAEASRFAESGARASGILGGDIPQAVSALVSRFDAAGAALDARLEGMRKEHEASLALTQDVSKMLAAVRAEREAQAKAAEEAAAARERERGRFAAVLAELVAAKAGLEAELAASEARGEERRKRAERAEALVSRIREAFDRP